MQTHNTPQGAGDGPMAEDAEAALRAAAFIAKWHGASGTEISTSQSFIIELCDLLALPRPHATPEQDYLFERPMKETLPDGSSLARRVDCYRRGAFVWESKKIDQSEAARRAGRSTRGFDEKVQRAYQQAASYARNLPASEGRPPFIVVADIGHFIELYAEFTRSGATYTAFPDPNNHRIRLADLARPEIRQRLRALWLDPLSLDPTRISARVTRQVSAELAELAKSLEAAGHAPQRVAAFLTRCLFAMFAEDIGLLPQDDEGQGGFVSLLTRYRTKPERLSKMLHLLWQGMDQGGPNGALEGDPTLRFNGKMFKGWNEDGYVLPLTPEQVDGLLRAARANWREVEPAIFGTLLERALNPIERHALGAHYTPRAYVERLVLPTVVEPLRADWADAQAAALVRLREHDEYLQAAEALKPGTADTPRKRTELEKKAAAALAEARAEVKRFHHQLCSTRVLDPACGSGNFLYVTLEHLKRLEAEVLNRLAELGQAQDALGFEGETVTVAQLLGIELNPRAAALAELVLWIGWLQWQVRTRGLGSVHEPVVHDYRNIDCRDAVLAHDAQELAVGPDGQVLTRWDGQTFKTHPVTGEPVPDEAAQVPQWRYLNPRPAAWPQAEFIVGNPPFIGASAMRAALGDGYTQTLRAAWPAVPESADFVMYWWHQAAQTVRAGRARRFGLITTNSLRQTFNRRVIQAQLHASPPLHLVFAVPDHPWVDSAEGAAVRIAMSVGSLEPAEGRLLSVTAETASDSDEIGVQLEERCGLLHADLRLGADVAGARPLRANGGISSPGVKLHGSGFIVSRTEAARLGLGTEPGLARHIREYRNGRDLTARPRDVLVIDLFGLTADEVRSRHPATFQWVLERVKPERDQNNRATYRDNWWTFGEPRREFRPALTGLPRYIATVETTKHRAFQFLDASVLPDNMLIAIASDNACHLGILSSQVHVEWALAAGGRLGVGNDPRYNKSRCFEPFTFPAEDSGLTPELAARIGKLAEAIDAHRKARQAAQEAVTLTGLYNVLEALRAGRVLSAKEKALHEQGLVSVLRSLHDELDSAVLAAYGWADLAPVPWPAEGDEAALATRQAWTDELLTRLVALNTRRAAEEAAGTVRWLRPEFQDPARRHAAAQTDEPATEPAVLPGVPAADAATEGGPDDAPAESGAAAAASATVTRQPWPAGLPQQTRAIAEVLATSPVPLSLAALAERFTGRGPWKKGLPGLLDVLESLGRAERLGTPEAPAWRVAG